MTLRGITLRAGWFLEAITWFLAKPVCRWLFRRQPPAGITIGITTFKERYESCLRPVLRKIHLLFPHDQIIIMANGHYQKEEQKAYLSEMEKYCSRFPNVELESFLDPMGLSFLWNRIIRRAVSEHVLIMNDDVQVKAGFRRFILRRKPEDVLLALINGSFSHFIISKKLTETIGCFDEGFREIGGEDDDYLARTAMAGTEVSYLTTCTIARKKLKRQVDALNSYGKRMSEERGGYSTVNTDYLESKWITSDTFFEGAVLVPNRKPRYWKMRDHSC